MHFSQPEFLSGHETEEIPGGFIAQRPKISDPMFPALPVLLQCPVKQPMNLLSCPNCAELWRLAMFLETSEIPHWRPCGLRRGRMTFDGCRQAWCFALSHRKEREEEKSRKLPQVGEGTAHIRLFYEQVPEELHPALGHPDPGPGCQGSCRLLLSKALGARPGVHKPFCWEKIWEAYVSDLKLAPVSQGW